MFDKIDINKVYIAEIWFVKKAEYVSGSIWLPLMNYRVRFVKNAIVELTDKENFHYSGYEYVNLQTDEKYFYGTNGCFGGEYFIKKLTPYTDIISVEKPKIGKKKVLQKYNEYQTKKKQCYESLTNIL